MEKKINKDCINDVVAEMPISVTDPPEVLKLLRKLSRPEMEKKINKDCINDVVEKMPIIITEPPECKKLGDSIAIKPRTDTFLVDHAKTSVEVTNPIRTQSIRITRSKVANKEKSPDLEPVIERRSRAQSVSEMKKVSMSLVTDTKVPSGARATRNTRKNTDTELSTNLTTITARARSEVISEIPKRMTRQRTLLEKTAKTTVPVNGKRLRLAEPEEPEVPNNKKLKPTSVEDLVTLKHKEKRMLDSPIGQSSPRSNPHPVKMRRTVSEMQSTRVDPCPLFAPNFPAEHVPILPSFLNPTGNETIRRISSQTVSTWSLHLLTTRWPKF